jgi:hypothetical protein
LLHPPVVTPTGAVVLTAIVTDQFDDASPVNGGVGGASVGGDPRNTDAHARVGATEYKYRVVTGVVNGRARVLFTFTDGMDLAVQYYTHPDSAEHVEHYSATLATKQWYTNQSDQFSRAPSYLNYDRRASASAETGLTNSSNGGVILQNDLAWIAGLSDECGAGCAMHCIPVLTTFN